MSSFFQRIASTLGLADANAKKPSSPKSPRSPWSSSPTVVKEFELQENFSRSPEFRRSSSMDSFGSGASDDDEVTFVSSDYRGAF